MESPIKKYITDSKNPDYQKQKILDDIMTHQSLYFKKMEIAKKNLNYWSNIQWTPDEIKEHEDQGRQAMVINVMDRIIKDFIGMEINTRLDSTLLARSKDDEDKVDKLNKLNKYTDQINDMDNVEKFAFINSFLKGVGWTVSRWDTLNMPNGCVITENVRTEEMGWDLNSIKLDLSDARYLFRIQLRTKLDLIESHPKWEDEITQECMGSFETWSNNLLWKEYFDKHGYTSFQTYRDFCPYIEYYERVKVYNYTIIDEINPDEETFDTLAEANANYEGRCKQYALDGEMLIGENGIPRIVLLTNKKEIITQTIMIGNTIVEDKDTTLPMFPYVPCFCNYLDGKYWSGAEGMIDEQDIINRSYSSFDQQLGSAAKSGYMIDPNAFSDPRVTQEQLRQDLNSPTPIVVIKPQYLTPLPQPNVNPAFFNIIQMISTEVEKNAGSNALLGRGASAESGTVAEFRAQQGSKGRLFFFDNLKVWKKQVTLLNSWYIKNFMSEGQTIRITGGDSKSDYLVLDDVLMDSLKELKYDIIVSETDKSESSRLQHLKLLDQLQATNVVPPIIMAAMRIELMPFTGEEKERLLSMIQFHVDWEKQQAQTAQDQKNVVDAQAMKDRQDIKEKLNLKDRILEIQQELEQAKSKLEQTTQDLQDKKVALHTQNLTPQEMENLKNSMITNNMGEENG
jgi:hypothetical protein